MKKVILIALTVLTFSGISFAQFEQGRILAGGSIGLKTNTNKTKNNNTTSTNSKSVDISVNPKAGYFIIDNLAIGAGLNITSTTQKADGSTEKETYTSTSIEPFVRYYIKPGIFFQGAFGVGPGKYKETNGNTTTTTKFNTSNWSLAAGYAIFLNNNVAIEPTIGYGSSTMKLKANDNKNIDSGLFINVGFQIYLGSKK